MHTRWKFRLVDGRGVRSKRQSQLVAASLSSRRTDDDPTAVYEMNGHGWMDMEMGQAYSVEVPSR
jgi:hypothetical protein